MNNYVNKCLNALTAPLIVIIFLAIQFYLKKQAFISYDMSIQTFAHIFIFAVIGVLLCYVIQNNSFKEKRQLRFVCLAWIFLFQIFNLANLLNHRSLLEVMLKSDFLTYVLHSDVISIFTGLYFYLFINSFLNREVN